MRILLVDPPFHSFMHYDRWYCSNSLAQLAAVAHAAGNEVFIYDADKYFFKDILTRNRAVLVDRQRLYYDNVADFNHYIWRHFYKTLEEINPEVVGVYVYTCKLQSALNALKLTRKFNSAIKRCVGGAHATAVPDTLISKDYIDAVFLGYADVTFPEWLRRRCPNGIIPSELNKIDLEKLPYPRRQSFLFQENFTPRDFGRIMTSRGCLGQCSFCSNSFMWCGKPKFRTSESIRAELNELVNEWKCTEIAVADATFSDMPEESKRVAGILKEFDAPWEANISWTSVSKDLLDYWIGCGCRKVFVGLESGSDKILKYMKKRCSRGLIREKSKILNSVGIEWHLLSITGFPEETIEDMNQTLEFAMEIQPNSISLNSLSPLPGTEVYKEIPGVTPEFASTVNQLHPNFCFSKHMSSEQFQDMFLKMTEAFEGYNQRKKIAQEVNK